MHVLFANMSVYYMHTVFAEDRKNLGVVMWLLENGLETSRRASSALIL